MHRYLREDDEIKDISELPEGKEYHFYGNSKTGVYYFNGERLVKIANSVASKLKEKQLQGEYPLTPEEEEKRKGKLAKIKSQIGSGKLVTQLKTDKLFYGSDEATNPDAFHHKPTGSKQQLIIDSITDFVSTQISTTIGMGYGKDSPMALDPDTIKKVRRHLREPKDIRIALYFDRSGSWGGTYESNFGNDIVASLKEFEEDEELNVMGVHVIVDVYYFAVHVWPEESMALREGNNSGEPIIQHMIETQPTNVIIMTDDHMQYPDDAGWWPDRKATKMKSRYVAPGGVWAIFINGVSNNLVKDYGDTSEWHLAGEEVTNVFTLRSGEK